MIYLTKRRASLSLLQRRRGTAVAVDEEIIKRKQFGGETVRKAIFLLAFSFVRCKG